MWPVFRSDRTSTSQLQISVVGTAFFIDSNGTFASVAHILDRTGAGVSYEFRGLVPDAVHNPPLAIQEVARDDGSDIFIGKIQLAGTSPLSLSPDLAEVGRTVCISGYPLAEMSANAQGALDVSRVRRYFQPSFVLDRGAGQAKGETGILRTHTGFLVRDFGLFGMSGGPVFDIDGTVLGIQASVTAPRESKSADGRTISVENALAIGSNLVSDLIRSRNITLS